MSAEPVVKIAEKKGVSPGTVLLSYHGMSPFVSLILRFIMQVLTLICSEPWQHSAGKVGYAHSHQGQPGDCRLGR